jgi:hypothetical protein
MTTDGNYSVKSGYQAIQDWKEDTKGPNTSSNHHPNPIWTKLWRLKIPPKYITLISRILQNALPVNSNLQKQGIQCYPLCPRCHEAIEDQNHVFSKCLWAQQTWFASPLNLKISNTNMTFNHWLSDCIQNLPSQNNDLICALCYHMWKARNLWVF